MIQIAWFAAGLIWGIALFGSSSCKSDPWFGGYYAPVAHVQHSHHHSHRRVVHSRPSVPVPKAVVQQSEQPVEPVANQEIIDWASKIIDEHRLPSVNPPVISDNQAKEKNMEQVVDFLPKAFSLLGMVVAAFWSWKYVLAPLLVKAGGLQAVESKAFTELKNRVHDIETDPILAELEARIKALEVTAAKPPGVPQVPQSPGT